MRNNTQEKRIVDSTSGVSETVGAILLISIVAISLGIVAVFLFSQPTPEKIPNVNFMTGVNTSQTTLYLYHNGGDTLNVGEFSVQVDGVPASYSVSGGGSQWTVGTNLIVPISKVPQSVQIIYNGTGMGGSTGSTGTVLLREASTAVVSSENVSADQLPYLDCSAVKNWDCADQIPPDIVLAQYMKNASAKKITLMKFNQPQGTVVSGGGFHFNFTVADATNSSLVIGTNTADTCLATNTADYKLSVGDKVNLTFAHTTAAPNDFLVYGMASQIWEMAGGNSGNIDVDLSYAVNGSTTRFLTNRLCHSYIERYSSLDSTLTVETDAVAKRTTLIVNNTKVIDSGSTTVIRLNNLKPLNNGLFLISFTSSGNANSYFIGWADTIQFGGVTQTGLGL